MDESPSKGLRPPKIAGDVIVARHLESAGVREQWRVSIADRIYFLTDHATAIRIHALAIASREVSTYADAHMIYKRERGSSAESLSSFVRWCETHRLRLEQLAKTPDNHGLSFRCSLLSGHACEHIGEALAWLFAPFAIAALGGFSLAAMFLYFLWPTPHNGASMWGAGAITLLGVLFHEFGHITACVRHRARQGGIGVGLYWIWPAFFADVRGSWALSASERLQVSIGGLYFQSIYAAVLAMVGTATGSATITLAIYLTMLLMGNTLNPILKYDGYWILSDWLNVTNLHTRIAAHLKVLCQPSRADWRVLIRSRMTLVAVAFTLFALAFVWLIFRSLTAAGASTISELSVAAGSVHRLFVAGSPTPTALAMALMKLGSVLVQLVFVVMGLMIFGIRSVRAMLNFASTTLGRT